MLATNTPRHTTPHHTTTQHTPVTVERFERFIESLQTVLADGETVIFAALQDVMSDESAFFTKDELMRLHDPAPEREHADA